MKKIADLEGKDFFVLLRRIFPIVPEIKEMETIKLKLGTSKNAEIDEIREDYRKEAAKLARANEMKDGDGTTAIKENTIDMCNQKIDVLAKKLSKINAGIAFNDAVQIMPTLLSESFETSFYEIIAMLDEEPLDAVKSYKAAKLISKIVTIVKETDFTDFLSSAEESDETD